MPYRFKKEFRDSIIEIPALRLRVNRFNLTDEIAEKLLKKFPKFSHNIEYYDDKAEVVNLPQTELSEVLDIPAPTGYIIDPDDVKEAEELPAEDYDNVEEELLTEEESKPEPKKQRRKRTPSAGGTSKKGKKQKDK